MRETMYRDVQVGRDVIHAEFFNSDGFESLLDKETKREKFYYDIMTPIWRVERFIKDVYWKIRYGFQRMFWGYDYRDLVGIDSGFVERYTKILTKYRKDHHGYPGAMTEEEWNGIVDEMIYHLWYMDEDHIDAELSKDVADNWIPTLDTTSNIAEKHKDEFFALFSKYFFYLWD